MSILIKHEETVNKEGVGVFSNGTRVYTSQGCEVHNITSININYSLNEVVTATVEVALDTSEDMGNIHALLGTQTLEQIAKLHNCRFIPND